MYTSTHRIFGLCFDFDLLGCAEVRGAVVLLPQERVDLALGVLVSLCCVIMCVNVCVLLYVVGLSCVMLCVDVCVDIFYVF